MGIYFQCGQIEEIRLVKNFKGQSKGYAYVQFADQLAVANALTYDRTPLDGRPMFVSKYEDRSSSQKTKADFKVKTYLTDKTLCFSIDERSQSGPVSTNMYM